MKRCSSSLRERQSDSCAITDATWAAPLSALLQGLDSHRIPRQSLGTRKEV